MVKSSTVNLTSKKATTTKITTIPTTIATTLGTLKPSTKDIFPLSQFYSTTTNVAKTSDWILEKDVNTINKNRGMMAITDPSELHFRSKLYDSSPSNSTIKKSDVHEIINLDKEQRRHTTLSQQNSVAQNFRCALVIFFFIL